MFLCWLARNAWAAQSRWISVHNSKHDGKRSSHQDQWHSWGFWVLHQSSFRGSHPKARPVFEKIPPSIQISLLGKVFGAWIQVWRVTPLTEQFSRCPGSKVDQVSWSDQNAPELRNVKAFPAWPCIWTGWGRKPPLFGTLRGLSGPLLGKWRSCLEARRIDSQIHRSTVSCSHHAWISRFV